jgi:riboflavin kinase/FMN adenylyltransferase
MGRGGTWLVGNYDGFHLGHQALLDAARGMGKPVSLLTFEPHPRRFFQPDTPPFRLTPWPEKAGFLREMGVEHVKMLPFDEKMAHLGAGDFVEKILLGDCGAEHVVIGPDFHFGAKRQGNTAFLREKMGDEAVVVVPPYLDAEGLPVSSSRIRQYLMDGKPEEAARLLGRTWHISGVVEKGAQKGREIGFPTANLALGDYLRPRFGVYVVTVEGYGPGIANIGTKPTVGGIKEGLEVHLFGQSPDLYGQRLCVHFHHFLRPEQRFDNLASLKQQIEADAAKARDWHKTSKPAI